MAYAGVPGAKVATVSRIHVKKKASGLPASFFLTEENETKARGVS